jgi:hypothetical protein
MKLLRFGSHGQERPGLLDDDGQIRDGLPGFGRGTGKLRTNGL